MKKLLQTEHPYTHLIEVQDAFMGLQLLRNQVLILPNHYGGKKLIGLTNKRVKHFCSNYGASSSIKCNERYISAGLTKADLKNNEYNQHI